MEEICIVYCKESESFWGFYSLKEAQKFTQKWDEYDLSNGDDPCNWDIGYTFIYPNAETAFEDG